MAEEPASNTGADAAYRRGTVLGLTVAEIFILLLFLLLLAFLTLVQGWEAERQSADAALHQAEEALQAVRQWKDVIDEFATPDEVLTLKRQKERAEREAEGHERRADELEQLLAAEDSGAAEAFKAAQDAERRAAEAREAAKGAERRAAEAREELRVLRTKGHNPPCWYQVVAAPGGGTREKPYYTLNLAVFDDGIVIRRSDVPEGGADDDNGGTFAEEAERLALASLPLDTMLSDAEVRTHLQPIHMAGKAKEVRTYSCVFWVRVWDKTSPTAKARWKQAHDKLIEGLFGAYTVRDDPWRP